jgi:PPOX class probable F420-dependent enzyme
VSAELARASYVSLASFRRDGREVRTPVWIAAEPHAAPGTPLFVYTNRTHGKVKRIRHTPRIRLAPCDVRGRVAADAAWTDAAVRIVDDDPTERRGIDALLAKYGWQMRLLLLGARIGGRWKDRCVLEIRTGAPHA